MKSARFAAVVAFAVTGFAAAPAAVDASAFHTVHESFDIPIFNDCTGDYVNMHVETDTEFLGLFEDASGQWHDTVRWTNASSETSDGFFGEPRLLTTNVSTGPFEDGHGRLAVNDVLTNPVTGQRLKVHGIEFVLYGEGVFFEFETSVCLGNG